jgi:glucose-1-phosphatase
LFLINAIRYRKANNAQEKQMEQIRMAIFDLGNVVFKCSFKNAPQYWSMKSGRPLNEIKDNYSVDTMYELLEVNQISIHQYKDHLCKLLNMHISLDDFIIGWNSIFMDEIEGMRALLGQLKNSLTLIALSNTNETHCQFMLRKYDTIFKYFDKIYFSHQIQARKPDETAFRKVLSYYQFKPDEIIFLDDLFENVDGAAKIGLKTIQVKTIENIIDGFHKYGIDLKSEHTGDFTG